VVDGRYRVVSHLASGGMGDVYRAEHVFMQRPVALKLMKPEFSRDVQAVALFEREAQVVARLDHPNVVRVYDCGRTREGLLYLAMELVDGESLHSVLARDGAWGVDRTVAVLSQLAEALHVAHGLGVVHRDVKPDNVLLVRVDPGEPDVAKVLDFGIARVLAGPDARLSLQGPAGALQTTGLLMGTPAYMAPEQVLTAPLDGRADQYALGVTAYRMLTGRLPFDGRVEELLRAHVELPPRPLADVDSSLAAFPRVCAVVERTLAKDRALRFPDLAGFARALVSALAEDRPPPVVDTSLPRIPGRLPLVGVRRGDEVLEAALVSVAAGGSRSVVFSGAPGQGGSRLVEEISRIAASRGFAVLGAPVPLHAAPALTLGGWLASLLRQAFPDGPLVDVLPRLGLGPAATGVLASALRLVPDDELPPAPALAAVTASVLSRFSARRPLLANFDDLDRADPLTREVVAALCSSDRAARTMVVAVSHAPVPADDVVPLAAAGPDEVRALVDAMSAHAQPALESWLVRHARGRMATAWELVAWLAEKGVLAAGASGFHVAGELPIPPGDAADLVTDRLNRLSARARELVAVCACTNGATEGLLGLFGLADATLLAELVSRGHLKPVRRGRVVVHVPSTSAHVSAGLAVAVSEAGERVRTLMDSALAAAPQFTDAPWPLVLRAALPEAVLADDGGRLAQRLEESGQRRLAADRWVALGRAAGSDDAAAHAFASAARCITPVDAARAGEWAAAAVEHFGRLGGEVRSIVALAAAEAAGAQGDGERHEAWLAHVVDPAWSVESERERAVAAEARGEAEIALLHYGAALELLSARVDPFALADPSEEARLELGAATSALLLGNRVEARARFERALGVAGLEGRWLLRAWLGLAACAEAEGDTAAGRDAYLQAVDACDRLGALSQGIRVRRRLAELLVRAGDGEGARAQRSVADDVERWFTAAARGKGTA